MRLSNYNLAELHTHLVTAGLVSSLASLAFSVVSVGNVGILETFLLDFLWGLFGFAYTSYILYSLLR